jgi:hypothetical protein
LSELGPYRTPEARTRELCELTGRAGGAIERYGESVQGRALEAARLPGPPGAPRVLLCANLHGVEVIGAHVALAFLEAAGTPGSPVHALRERAELWIAPCLNPDGYARTFEQAGRGRLAELRTNAHGVDLNRNYPLPSGRATRWLPGAGSTRPGDATYRGPAPLSEPEAAGLAALCRSERFVASANLHSTMGTLIPARVTDRASHATYRALCRSFRRAQPSWRYLRLQSRFFDVFTGEQEDFQHHALGCWAVCVEVFPILASLRQHLFAPSLFWRFNARTPGTWVQNDLPGLCAFFAHALSLPRLP